MQLILDEIHALQKEWDGQGNGEWAEASIINSSKVLVVTVSTKSSIALMKGNTWCCWTSGGTASGDESGYSCLGRGYAVGPFCCISSRQTRLTGRCPYNTKLMTHAEPNLGRFIDNAQFRPPSISEPITILDPVSTMPVSPFPLDLYTIQKQALMPHR